MSNRNANFTDPLLGLEHLVSSLERDSSKTILFLDINMPVLTGWEVLNKLKEREQKILEPLTVYILSSSIDPQDMNLATTYSMVEGFISKPLTTHKDKILAETLKHLCAPQRDIQNETV